jgi:hypothetical protein
LKWKGSESRKRNERNWNGKEAERKKKNLENPRGCMNDE